MRLFIALTLALAALCAGCAGTSAGPREVSLEIHRGEYQNVKGWRETAISGMGRQVYLDPEVKLNENHVADAKALKMTTPEELALAKRDKREPEATGSAVAVTFTREGRRLLYKMTTENFGALMVVLLDRRPVLAAEIRQPIRDGRLLIVGQFTPNEAIRLANGISGRKASSTPAP